MNAVNVMNAVNAVNVVNAVNAVNAANAMAAVTAMTDGMAVTTVNTVAVADALADTISLVYGFGGFENLSVVIMLLNRLRLYVSVADVAAVTDCMAGTVTAVANMTDTLMTTDGFDGAGAVTDGNDSMDGTAMTNVSAMTDAVTDVSGTGGIADLLETEAIDPTEGGTDMDKLSLTEGC